MKVITSEEMNRLDCESAVEAEVLMERAGRGMAEFIRDSLPKMPVIFLCGTGNNGGDGMVASRYLKKWGCRTQVYLISDKKLKGLPALQEKRFPGKIEALKDPGELEFILKGREISVDCMLGTGFRPPLGQDARDILEIVNKKSKIIISCDIPTGVDASTAEADIGSARADATVTFEYPKTGHVRVPGSVHSGSIEVVGIGTGIEPQKYERRFEIITRDDCGGYFERRKKRSHKKDYGHVLIIGGKTGMEGAVSMAAGGALKSGAGLLSCAVSESVAAAMPRASLSSINLVLEDGPSGAPTVQWAGKILEHTAKRKVDAVVLGPGMGTAQTSAELVNTLIKEVPCPLVIDADALNCVSAAPDILNERKGRPTVITPHPGEMSRLWRGEGEEVLKKPLESAGVFAGKHSVVVILKGYRSVVSDGKKVFINATGGPAMAVGGSGDILSGIAGTLLGQGFAPLQAAKTAAWVHGRAGDLAAWCKGERAALPEDFLENMERV